MIQGRFGAEVLPYSESLADVSLTSTAPEVWRSLGYWLFYVRDPYAATTTESLRYLSSTASIFVSYMLPIVCLLGLVWVRWAHRRFAALLVAAGALLGGRRAPDRRPVAADAGCSPVTTRAGLALALRSSTRALPVMNLGLALLAGSFVAACAGVRLRRPAWRVDSSIAAGADRGSRSSTCRRCGPVPSSTRRSSATSLRLRRGPTPPPIARRGRRHRAACCSCRAPSSAPSGGGTRSTNRCPGLTDKPLITRDLLPLGSAGGDGPAVRPRRPGPGRGVRTVVVGTRLAMARRRHGLGRQRPRLRPLPHGPAARR